MDIEGLGIEENFGNAQHTTMYAYGKDKWFGVGNLVLERGTLKQRVIPSVLWKSY